MVDWFNSFDLESMLFVLSIAFQLAGALILLFNSISKKQIEENSDGFPVFVLDEDGALSPELSKSGDERARIAYKNICLNRFSFSYLAVGYFMTIFAVNNGDKVLTVRMVLLLSTALTFISRVISVIISKKKVESNE